MKSARLPYEAEGAARLASQFLRAMVSTLGWRLALALTVSVALGLTEGAGLVLLAPLLAAIGLVVTDGPIGDVAAWTSRAFDVIGVTPSLPVVLLAFMGLTIAHAGFYRWHLVLDPATEQQFTLALRDRLYAAVVSARWSFLVQRRTTDLAHALTGDIERVSTAAYQLLRLIAALVATAVYVVVAARLSLTLTLLGGGGSLVVLWLLRGGTRHSTERGAAHSDADRRLSGMVHESLGGLKVAKTTGAAERDVARHRQLARAASRQYLAVIASLAQTKYRADVISAAGLSLLLLVAATGFGLRGASLLLLMFVFSRLVPRVMTLQQSVQLFAVGLPAFGRVQALCQQCEAEAEQPVASGRRLDLTRRLRLESVSFAYPPGTRRVLDGICLDITAGVTTAIVGPSGGGKSTLADVLIGLLGPDSGRVLIDDTPLTPDCLDAWRRSVGYVTQDTFLLHESIRANLAWAAPDAAEADMWEALEMSAAAAFVAALPEGLDTLAGDRGIRLSGGERQRIALARALLRRPSLLILDEATSALDSESERQILDAIARLNGTVTIVLITHRLTAVRDAAIVHVVEGGRIVESGTWEVLRGGTGTFGRLWKAQEEGPAALPDPARWLMA